MSKTFGIERRALIAFVASMALFLLYDSLYLAPKMREQREQRERRETVALSQAQEMARLEKANERTGADTLRTSNEPPALVPAAPGDTLAASFALPDTGLVDAPTKKIVVASPLFEITIDSRGAAIVSAHLLRFAGVGGPVELLPPGDSW
ncbi:MAG TPA: hypothetical protein VI565_04250, partial [Burkholderiales bacterium]|nr:hypothetical protein [Burkholderiales bacterium]